MVYYISTWALITCCVVVGQEHSKPRIITISCLIFRHLLLAHSVDVPLGHLSPGRQPGGGQARGPVEGASKRFSVASLEGCKQSEHKNFTHSFQFKIKSISVWPKDSLAVMEMVSPLDTWTGVFENALLNGDSMLRLNTSSERQPVVAVMLLEEVPGMREHLLFTLS